MSQWVQMSNGMGNRNVFCLAANGSYLFAGTVNLSGVFVSTNYGANWTQTSLNNVSVASLLVNGSNVFAGTAGNGVYISSDSGTSWTQTSLNNRTVYSLVSNGNNIFAGIFNNPPGLQGVFMSTNNGTNWTQTSLNNVSVNSMAVNGNNIFTGVWTTGVQRSTDNGTTWTQTLLNNRTIWAVAVSGSNVFAGADPYGVYLSTDNGTTWTQSSLNNDGVYSLAVISNNIFAGTSLSHVSVSSNNGTNWTQRDEGLGNQTPKAFCMFNNYVFAGTQTNGVYRRPLSELTGIQPISNEIPNHFSLSQNYPNPFNPSTVIRYSLIVNSEVSIKIYDILGQEAAVIVNEKQQPGIYEVEWDATNYPSGVYFYQLTARDYTETRKMILLK